MALVKRSVLVILSAGAMGGVVWFLLERLAPYLATGVGALTQGLAILAIVAVAMAVYFGLALATGAADRAMVRNLLKGRRSKRGSEPSTGAFHQSRRSAGTCPPFSASFVMTALCSHVFMVAESFVSPV